jgi:predicted AAA+ superfamily ATPase
LADLALDALPGTLFYWSDGSFEVDFVRICDGKIFAYEVKSGHISKAKSLERFQKKYPSAVVTILDRDSVAGMN